MRNPEKTTSFNESTGGIARNLGIMGGVVGLIIESANLFVGGIGLAVSGEIFRRLGRKPLPKAA